MKKLGKVAIFMTAVMLLATSCRHRTLYVSERNLRIVFNWDDAADATPRSMVVYFFPKDTQNGGNVRYSFGHVSNGKLPPENLEGGSLSIREGVYDVLCINTETDYLVYPAVESAIYNSFTVSTGTRPLFSGNTIGVRSGGGAVPAAAGARASERLAYAPDPLWCDYFSDVYIFDDENMKLGLVPDEGRALELDENGVQKLTLYPKSAVHTVNVVVEGIENLEYASTIVGSLSGMAGGFIVSQRALSPEKVTVPFEMGKVLPTRANGSTGSLTAQFYTFGHCPAEVNEHKLSLHFIMQDGMQVDLPSYNEATGTWKFGFDGDVTAQIPHTSASGLDSNFTVRIGDQPGDEKIVLPKPAFGTGGGFQPNVEDWEEEEVIIIPMGGF